MKLNTIKSSITEDKCNQFLKNAKEHNQRNSYAILKDQSFRYGWLSMCKIEDNRFQLGIFIMDISCFLIFNSKDRDIICQLGNNTETRRIDSSDLKEIVLYALIKNSQHLSQTQVNGNSNNYRAQNRKGLHFQRMSEQRKTSKYYKSKTFEGMFVKTIDEEILKQFIAFAKEARIALVQCKGVKTPYELMNLTEIMAKIPSNKDFTIGTRSDAGNIHDEDIDESSPELSF